MRADGLVQTEIDGGPCAIGVESTIVEVINGHAQILRAGAVTAEEIAEVLKHDVQAKSSGAIRAPGMMASHYAPRAAVALVARGGIVPAGEWKRVGYLGTGPAPVGAVVLNAPQPYTAETLAPVLYARLREADELGLSLLVVEPPTDERHLSAAVIDRLTRAAASR